MPWDDPISQAWNAHQSFLVDLAFRMLGDIGVAEDVVQEAFFRLLQTPEVEDERGWLIVVTSRLCLDHLRSAQARRERPEDLATETYLDKGSGSVDPADRVTLDDEVRLALLVVLGRLTAAERVAFVLHDVFQLPFDVIAQTVGRPSAACRQLAHRARRKIEASRDAGTITVDPAEHAAVTRQFITACANGDLGGLTAVLDPGVSGEVDTREGLVVRGPDQVARNLLRFWHRRGVVLAAHPADETLVLAFQERRLVGLLALTIDHAKVIKVHVYVTEPRLAPVRSQLSGTA